MGNTNPQTSNSDKLDCSICGKKNHTTETCFSKRPQTGNKSELSCSHCHKKGHVKEKCYAIHGKPSVQGNPRSGPQVSSTFKGKHQVAAVQICEPKQYMIFENSVINKQELIEQNETYSLLENSQEDENQIFTTCTIVNKNTKQVDNGFLDPYSLAKIEGSDIPQRLLRDTGSFVSIVKQDLVPKRCYTNRTINLQFADGNIPTVPTALMKINSDCFSGTMEFAVLKNPVAPIIVGNMRGVTENFGNRKITNEISQAAKQEIVENKPKFEQMQKVEVSPVAKHRKISEPETNVKNSKQSTNEVGNDSMKENKQCSKVFENSNQKNNLTMISMEQKSNVNNSEQLNLINEVDSIVVENNKSVEVPTNKNTQILTLIDNNDQEIIPINAVLTRNQARQLDNKKEPNMLLQIPDISTDKFKEMQKSDKGLDRFWKIALGKTTQDENSKAIF